MADNLTTTTRPRHEYRLADRFIEPFSRMRSGVDHLIEDLPARLSAFQFGVAPAVEMTEADDCYTVAVEVPGIPLADIDLQVDRDMLILKGEKKEEHEDKGRDYVIAERSYGSFERRIALPADAMIEDVNAEAENGVLKIVIPRRGDASSQRRHIKIKTHK